LAVDKELYTQILVTFPNEMVELIETYWHESKLKSRTESIRKLVEIGLEKSKPAN